MSGSSGKLRFAVSCSSNMNRSMEAHQFLKKRGFIVESFGSGSQVKLPGPAPDKPNCYDFGVVSYNDIYNDLASKDKTLNRRIKDAPQKFQTCNERFDVIICLEERVYDQILEHLQTREEDDGQSVHVINIDIQDNHEEATLGALFVGELCSRLEACDDLDNEIDEVLTELEAVHSKRNLLHTICFY